MHNPDNIYDGFCLSKAEFFYITQNKHLKDEIIKAIADVPEKMSARELFSKQYRDPFALYYYPKDENDTSLDITPIEKCVGYSYGDHYNRESEESPLPPKTLFLETSSGILQLKSIGENIVIDIVPYKDIGRDAYYPNSHSYITQENPVKIVTEIIKTSTMKMILGAPIRFGKDFDICDVQNIYAEFEEKTKSHANAIYVPVKEITVDDLINDEMNLGTVINDFIKDGKNIISKDIINNIKGQR